MPPECARFKARAHLLALWAFGWELSECWWFPISCSPRTNPKGSPFPLEPKASYFCAAVKRDSSCSSSKSCCVTLKQNPGASPPLQSFEPKGEHQSQPTKPWLWLSLPKVLVPQWDAALPLHFILCPLTVWDRRVVLVLFISSLCGDQRDLGSKHF